MKKIVHLTSVHSPNDPRIFSRECKSLAENGYKVILIVPHTKDEVIEGVRIKKVPIPQNGYKRITKTIWQVYKAAREERAAINHFHDPELIFVGLLLRMQGAKVIYDVHEDYITSIQQKGYIPKIWRRFLASVIGWIEKLAQKFFYIVLAERYYEQRFPDGCKILNYPAFNIIHNPIENKVNKSLLYTGNISEDRGALNLAYLAQKLHDVNIYMIGRCSGELHEKMIRIAGNNNDRIHVRGIDKYIPHKEIIRTYKSGSWLAGLALFPATPHYMNKELTKFFEYMAAGIPVLCSNFPAWKKLINRTGAGICVDPENISQISEAINYLYENPKIRNKMGHSGQKAIKEIYNWEQESKKLLSLYREIISDKVTPDNNLFRSSMLTELINQDKIL